MYKLFYIYISAGPDWSTICADRRNKVAGLQVFEWAFHFFGTFIYLAFDIYLVFSPDKCGDSKNVFTSIQAVQP